MTPGPRRGFATAAPSARQLPAAGGVLLADAASTAGGFSLIRSTVPPGDRTPLHRHLDVDESFYVLTGSLTVTCGDAELEVAAGGFVHLPRGLSHSYLAGPHGGEMLILAVPGGLERFFDDWEDGLDLDELGSRHRIEFLEQPPRPT